MSELTTLPETAQGESLAYSGLTEDTGRGYQRLTYRGIRLARDLRSQHKTQTEIAQILGVSQPAISQALKEIGDDSTDLAVELAKGTAYRRARRLNAWSKKRDKVGLDSSKHLDAIAGITEKSNPVNQIAIVLGVTVQAPSGPMDEAKVLVVESK